MRGPAAAVERAKRMVDAAGATIVGGVDRLRRTVTWRREQD
ncbi:MAG TPA: hypothetical protein VIF08_08545 [Candidatus Limnocylindrales bacterium]